LTTHSASSSSNCKITMTLSSSFKQTTWNIHLRFVKKFKFATLVLIGLVVMFGKFEHSLFDFSKNHQTPQEVEERLERNSQDLRFLTFGTSRTYGSKLANRLDAYPYLLSPNVANLAMPATGPDYPSLCAQSMVGDEDYFDVITFEFYPILSDDLEILVDRVRERFPNATMIFLVMNPPFLFFHKTDDNGLRGLLSKHIHTPDFSDRVEKVLEGTESHEWGLTKSEASIAFYDRIAQSVNGYVLDIQVPEDMFQAIRLYTHYFQPDLTHFTEFGHKIVYNGIMKILEDESVTRHNEVGEWGHTDNCDLWYRSGETNISHSSMELQNFNGGKNNDKYAFEVPNNKTSWIDVINTDLTGESSLWVQFMATNSPGIYPDILFSINKDVTTISPTIPKYPFNVHVTTTMRVSSGLPLGTSRLHMNPIGDATEEHPFRITGIIVTPSKKSVNLLWA